MTRYRELVTETAGLYNTVGFNDDTRAFPSIPARHDLSRRVDANWIAGLVVRGIVDMDDAEEMIHGHRLPPGQARLPALAGADLRTDTSRFLGHRRQSCRLPSVTARATGGDP